MSSLKQETLNTCFSLLREYINDSSKNQRTKSAKLALEQLQLITAGQEGEQRDLSCNGKPRANETTIFINE